MILNYNTAQNILIVEKKVSNNQQIINKVVENKILTLKYYKKVFKMITKNQTIKFQKLMNLVKIYLKIIVIIK